MSGVVSPDQIAQLALVNKLPANAAVTAVAVALAESGGNPNADNGADMGLWQINRPTWLTRLFNPSSPNYIGCDHPFDVNCNAKAMALISRGGSSWGDWTTYTGLYPDSPGGPNVQHTPAYLRHLDSARAAVKNVYGEALASGNLSSGNGSSGTVDSGSGKLAAGGTGVGYSGRFVLHLPIGDVDVSGAVWGVMIVGGGALLLGAAWILVTQALAAPLAAVEKAKGSTTRAARLVGRRGARKGGKKGKAASPAKVRASFVLPKTDSLPAASPKAAKVPAKQVRLGDRYYREGSTALKTAKLRQGRAAKMRATVRRANSGDVAARNQIRKQMAS
ncbi:MAG: transglycosylase SLT domain-containing protein [Candidatus Dormibacteria bacterium]